MPADLTPEAWEAARQVLAGETDHAVSWSAAAKAADVRVRDLRAWIARAQEKRPEDDPWIHAIADDAEAFVEHQAGRMEDRLWQIANDPQKPKPDVALSLLKVRDRRYQPDSGKPEVTISIEGQADVFPAPHRGQTAHGRQAAVAVTDRAA